MDELHDSSPLQEIAHLDITVASKKQSIDGTSMSNGGHSLHNSCTKLDHDLGSSLLASDNRENLRNSTRCLITAQLDGVAKIVPEERKRKACKHVDTGYAWVVLAASFILQIVSACPIASAGLFVVALQEDYPEQKGIISLMNSVQVALPYIVGPFCAILIDKTSHRLVTMLGLICMSLCLVVSCFMQHIGALFTFYGILSALSTSMIYFPTATFVTLYFEKKRMMALLAMGTAPAITYMAMPPLVDILMQHYAWQGAAMFIACLHMQAVVCSALMFPPPSMPIPSQIENEESVLKSQEAASGRALVAYHNGNHFGSNHKVQGSLQERADSENQLTETTDQLLKDSKDETHTSRETSSPNGHAQNYTKDAADTLTCKTLKTEGISTGSASRMALNRSRCGKFGSLISINYGVFLIGMLTYGWGGSMFYILLANFAVDNGLATSQAAQLFTISGVSNLAVRVFCSILGHLYEYDKVALFTAGFSLTAIAMFCFTITSGFTFFAILSAVFTIGYGCVAVLTTPVLLTLQGQSGIEMGFGVGMTFQGLTMIAAAPFASFLHSRTTTHTLGFRLAAAILACGSAAFVPLLIKSRLGACRTGKEIERC